jgi:chromosome segregation ATPase
MSNTNVQINSSKSRVWFANRKYHNNRQTNLNDSDFKEDKCINIVDIVDKNVGLKTSAGDGVIQNISVSAGTYSENLANFYKIYDVPKNLQGLKRSEYTSKLASNNSKIVKYERELEDIGKSLEKLVNEQKTDTIEFERLNKKYSKKKNETIKKAKNKSNILQTLRDYTTAKIVDNKNKNRKNFVEITFSITKAPNHLKRDIQYGKDILEVVKEFYQSLDFNMKLHSYSLHLDQSSPHCHILGSYENTNHSLNNDLEDRYGKKFNYHSLQNEFNVFIRNHKLLQKYKHIQELETITRGSKWEYEKNLKKFKEKSKQIEKDVIQEVKSVTDIKNKFFLVEYTREEILEDTLIEQMKENRLKSSISTKLEQENEKMTNNIQNIQNSLNKALNDVNIIKAQDMKIHNLQNEIDFYKNKFEVLDLQNDELKQKLKKFTANESIQKGVYRNR